MIHTSVIEGARDALPYGNACIVKSIEMKGYKNVKHSDNSEEGKFKSIVH